MRRHLKKSMMLAGTLAAALTASVPASAAETVLFFDFFFADNLGFPQDNLNTFIQWNVTGGSVDLVGGIGPGVFGAPPEQPLGRYVDLGGSTGNPGLFETRLVFDLLPGATYELSFDYRSTLPGQRNTATASFGASSFTVTSDSEQFTNFSERFVVDSLLSSRLTFQGLESDIDNNGLGVDGILLKLVLLPDGTAPVDPGLPLPPGAGAVPEPANWAMMIGGIGLAGGALRRRRATGSIRYV